MDRINYFNTIKQQYVECREVERKIIVSRLKGEGYSKINQKDMDNRGGEGITEYTSGHQMKFCHNLSNWKWVECEKNGEIYLISLQSFDQNPNSKNHLVLMDRLGICKYKKYDPEAVFKNMTITEMELPMDKAKLDELVLDLERLELLD